MENLNAKIKNQTAIIFILAGVVILGVATFWETFREEKLFLEAWCINFLSHLGIGAILIGIVGILIDMDHWTDYFKKRLAEIVMDKKYLENLAPSSLINLQTEVLRAYFRNDAIGGEDGFLKYYQQSIQNIIGDPFRINVVADLRVEYANEQKDKITVHEEISYTCKSNRGRIQNDVRWMAEPGEYDNFENIAVRLRYESAEGGQRTRKEVEFKYVDFKPEWKRELGFIMPLTDFAKEDGLEVIVMLKYVMSVSRFSAWRMAFVSKGMTMTIRFPEDLTIATEFYSMGRDAYDVKSNEKGYCRIIAQKWLLPNDGVTFQFLPKNS